MAWIKVQDLVGVEIVEGGGFGSHDYSWDGDNFYLASANNAMNAFDRFTGSSYKTVEITLPAGYLYLGGIRATVVAAVNNSPYGKYVDLVTSASADPNVPAPQQQEFEYEGLLLPGVVIHTGAGVNDGSPSSNSATWMLEVDAEVQILPDCFWTAKVGAVEPCDA